MWTAVELDDFPGRVRAVSAPDSRQMLVVWTTDGLYGVWFARAATVLRMGSPADAEHAFDAARGVLTWKGVEFRMHGECGPAGTRCGCDLSASTPNGDQLTYNATGRLAGVEASDGTTVPIADPPRAGKWSAVGFSEDGRYLLVADEWGVRLFRHAPRKGAVTHRAAASPEREALFAALCAAPDDDTPRLVYADWLAENGDPARGEFIQLQCEFSRGLRAGDPFPSDEARMQELLDAHGDRWEAELPAVRGVTWSGFWRGFPGVTVASAGTLARNAEAVWAAAPVESVVISKLDPRGAEALAKCPRLDRLRILELRNYSSLRAGAGCDPLRTLLACDKLSGLWWLAFLGNSRLGGEAVELLANSPSLRNLEVLTLRWCEIGDDGGQLLARSPHLGKLRDLDLTGNEFTGDTPSLLRKRFHGVRF
jgi:uncharacterized protein (TIGR02996 family)